MKEQIQDYWNRQPCNSKHSDKPQNTPEYWAEVTAKKYRAEPHIEAFANHAAWRGRRVLEVGCGIGTDAEQFVRAGADYVGVDYSDRSVELCKLRFETLGLEGKFICADAEQPEFRQHFEDHFDRVYSFGVLHHTPHPEAAIDNIWHLLKPGGELALMLYATNSWKNCLIEAGLAQPEAQAGCPLAKTYTKREVKALLKDFSDVTITQDHIFPWQIDKYKQNQWVKEPWFAAMPDDIFQALQQRLGWHLLIKAVK